MNSDIITYHLEGLILTITIDDGKRNVVSPNMLKQFNQALDVAIKHNAVVIITGKNDVFSAGFDLKILKSGLFSALSMVSGGFKFAYRLLSFPTPVIIACNGHAMAMGAFILLSGDYRIGADGNYNITTNEVAIGLVVPKAAIEINRQRLAPAHFNRATMLAEYYSPANAVESGFMDEIVPYDKIMHVAKNKAKAYLKLDLNAHYQTKLRARKNNLKAIKKGIFTDRFSLMWMGAKRLLGK